MKTNLFMILSVLLVMLLLGPASQAQLSPAAQKAAEYFKHDLDNVSDTAPQKSRVPASRLKKKAVLQKKATKKMSSKKSKKKQRREVAGKGVPTVLPPKKK